LLSFIDSFVPSLSLSSLLFLSYQTHTHTHTTSVCLSACLSCVLSSPLLPLFHSFFSSSSLLLHFSLSLSDSPLHRSRLLIYSFFVGFSRMPVGRRGASSLHSLVKKRASSSRTPRKRGGERLLSGIKSSSLVLVLILVPLLSSLLSPRALNDQTTPKMNDTL